MAIEQVYEKRDEILRIAAKHVARNVRVFGSVARGEANPEIDSAPLAHAEDNVPSD